MLEISVPKEDFDNLWHGIVHQWPSYLAYVTSFLTIGGLWLAHHSIFGRLAKVSGVVMRLNIVLLMFVSFLPFPTRLMAEALRDRDAERAATIFYGATMLAIALVISAMWQAVTRRRDLVRPEVTDREMQEIGLATAPNIGFYVAMTAFALLAPRLAVFGYLVIACVAVLRARGDTPDEA